MFFYFLLGTFSYAEEAILDTNQIYIGAEAQTTLINENAGPLTFGAHTQVRGSTSQPSLYLDLSFLSRTEPDDDFKAVLQNIIEMSASSESNINVENISWQANGIFASIGTEIPMPVIGENGFLRFGGEVDGLFQPQMYTQILEETSIIVDYSNLIRLGVFLDIGNETTMGNSKISYSLVTAYLAGAYTSGGSLREENSGSSLEEWNNNNGTDFTHASYANNQYFVGTEIYYHTPTVSVFLNARKGSFERSEVSKWYAEQNGTSVEGKGYTRLGLGLGRLF